MSCCHQLFPNDKGHSSWAGKLEGAVGAYVLSAIGSAISQPAVMLDHPVDVDSGDNGEDSVAGAMAPVIVLIESEDEDLQTSARDVHADASGVAAMDGDENIWDGMLTESSADSDSESERKPASSDTEADDAIWQHYRDLRAPQEPVFAADVEAAVSSASRAAPLKPILQLRLAGRGKRRHAGGKSLCIVLAVAAVACRCCCS